MRIENIAKTLLLPAVLLPLQAKGNSEGAFKKTPSIVSSSNLKELQVEPTNINSIALARIIKSTNVNYSITEVITDPEKIDRDKYDAYYKVDTKNKGNFYIVQSSEGRTSALFYCAYKEKEKNDGFVFPEPENPNTPVAVVSAKSSGLDGIFEIYDKNGAYKVNYKFSPILYTPDHSQVNSKYLFNMEKILRSFPERLVAEFNSRGIRVLIAKDIQDSYYAYYPSWKFHDDTHPPDPNLPILEKTENGWKDNRRYANIGGLYIDSTAIMPQQWIKYGTSDEIIDRSDKFVATKATVFHELGHALDYINSSPFSDTESYKTAYSKDVKNIAEDKQEAVAYFLMARREAFAELTAALTGGLPKNRAALMLSTFPQAAENIRKRVLPTFGVEISIDDIKKDIYPDYLSKKTKTASLEETKELFTMFTHNENFEDLGDVILLKNKPFVRQDADKQTIPANKI